MKKQHTDCIAFGRLISRVKEGVNSLFAGSITVVVVAEPTVELLGLVVVVVSTARNQRKI